MNDILANQLKVVGSNEKLGLRHGRKLLIAELEDSLDRADALDASEAAIHISYAIDILKTLDSTGSESS